MIGGDTIAYISAKISCCTMPGHCNRQREIIYRGFLYDGRMRNDSVHLYQDLVLHDARSL